MNESDRRAAEARELSRALRNATHDVASAWRQWRSTRFTALFMWPLAIFAGLVTTFPWTWERLLLALLPAVLMGIGIWTNAYGSRRQRREYLFLCKAHRSAYESASRFEDHIGPSKIPSFAYRELRWSLEHALAFVPERVLSEKLANYFRDPYWYGEHEQLHTLETMRADD